MRATRHQFSTTKPNRIQFLSVGLLTPQYNFAAYDFSFNTLENSLRVLPASLLASNPYSFPSLRMWRALRGRNTFLHTFKRTLGILSIKPFMELIPRPFGRQMRNERRRAIRTTTLRLLEVSYRSRTDQQPFQLFSSK